MKLKSIFLLGLTGLMSLSLLSACGKDKSAASDRGKAVSSFGGKFGGMGGDSAEIVSELRKLAFAQYQKHESEITRQIKMGLGDTIKLTEEIDFCSGIDADVEIEGATCGASTCESEMSESALSISFSQSCTGDESSSTCDGVTYTMSNMNMSFSFDISMNPTTEAGTISILSNVTGTAGSSDNSVSGPVACKFSFKSDINNLDDMACNDADFDCTVGGEQLTCAEMTDSSKQCRS